MLQAFTAAGRFWRGNIHGHSDRSDGAIPPAEVCRRYRAHGYDFISLTDHFLESYDFPITDTAQYRDEAFTTIPGAELHSGRNSRGEVWHILAVGLPDGFARPLDGETGPEIARRAREAGAFVAIAHPEWSQLSLEDARSLDAAHAIEVYNHISEVNAARGGGAGLYDQMLFDGLRPYCIAVDDSHWKSDDSFGGWVMVKAESNTPDALLAALKAGAFYATQGPEISDIGLSGDTLTVRCSPVSTAILAGPGCRAKAVHGRSMTEVSLSLGDFRGGWCRLTLVCAAGRKCWSQVMDLT